MSSDIKPVIFTIDSAGNLNLNCGVNKYDDTHCNYTGKLADTFEYPYTIELTFNISSHASITSCYYSKDNWFNSKISELSPKSQTGKFTFSDASTCAVSIYTIERGTTFGGWVNWANSINNYTFTKQ